MAQHNFLQWNPGQANIEADSDYAANSQRSGGAVDPSQFASILANKLFFQCSTMISALAQMMKNKGYSPVDGTSPFTAAGTPSTAVINLATVLANLLTNADVATLFASPAFTGNPTAPTQAPGNNSTRLATTAFVAAVLSGLVTSFQIPSSGTGYIQFGPLLGGIIIEFSANISAGSSPDTITLPLAMPNAIVCVMVAPYGSSLQGVGGVVAGSGSSKTQIIVDWQGGGTAKFSYIVIGY